MSGVVWIKRLCKGAVALAVVAWVVTSTTVPETCVGWLGTGVRALERVVARGHQRTISQFSATLAELEADIERAEAALNVAATDTEREQLRREIADARTVVDYLRAKVGGENHELWSLGRKYDQALAEQRAERGYAPVAATKETATRIERMQTAIADLEQRLDELTAKTKNDATVAKLREDIQGLIRTVQGAE